MFEATLEGEEEFLRDARHYCQDIWRGSRDAVRDACKAGVEAAKRGSFKDRSGDLRREMTFVMVRESDIEIEADMVSPVPYSSFVDAGTEPHDIWPKKGERFKGPTRQGQSRRSSGDIGTHRVALRWTDAGGLHFARMVHHPGSRPHPFFGTAYIVAEQRLRAGLEAMAAKAAERFQ